MIEQKIKFPFNCSDLDKVSDMPSFDINEHQPIPSHNSNPAIWDLVTADMKVRDEVGLHRYGTRLQAFNGRDCLIDAYQEALDLACYLRQAIFERDGK